MSIPPNAVDGFDLGSLSRGLLEAAPDPIVIVDDRGRIVLVNDRAAVVFGFDPSELVGQPVELLVPERFRTNHVGVRIAYQGQPQIRRMGSKTAQLAGRRKDGSEFPVDVSLSPFHSPQGQFVISIIRDVSDRVAIEQQLRHLSTHDALTGLYNRAFFDEEMMRLDRGRLPVGIVIADIDGLKEANDRDGHQSGDLLLQRAAAALGIAFRADDVIARLGGDEFGALLPGIGADELIAITERVRAIADNASAEAVQLSVGCATATPGQLAEGLRQADAAMYLDKRTRQQRRK